MDLDILFLEIGNIIPLCLECKSEMPSLQQQLQQVAYYAEKC